MHIDIYGYVKGDINSIIMKGNGIMRKNVHPINRISGFVCFFFLGVAPMKGAAPSTPAGPLQGALPLDPAKGIALAPSQGRCP